MNRVRELRIRAGMQQKELAIALNVQQPSVSRWEQQKSDPTDENVAKLAELFNVSPSDIVYYAPQPEPAWNVEYPEGVMLRTTRTSSGLTDEIKFLSFYFSPSARLTDEVYLSSP